MRDSAARLRRRLLVIATAVALLAWSAPTAVTAAPSADTNFGTLTVDGTAKTVTMSTAGQSGYLTFAGTVNQRVAIQSTNASAALLCCYVSWTVYNPDGSQLGSTRIGNDYLDTTALPATGSYTLRVTPNAGLTGSITITAWTVPADVNAGSLALDGTAKTVTTTGPGQNGYLTFTGAAGQRVTLQSTNASAVLLCCYVSWALYNPDGTQLSPTRYGNDSLDATTLPTAGLYQLRVDPLEGRTGSITLAAWDVQPDVNLGALTPDGTPKTVTMGSAGQNGYLTFTGSAGQRAAVQISGTSASLNCCSLSWGLYAPDGTRLGSTRIGNDFLDTVTLPAAGTYQVRLDPAGSLTGSATVSTWIVPADAALGTMPVDGSAKTVTIGTPGQNGYLTFTGTTGQRISVQTSNASATLLCCFVTWTLYAPDGTQLGSTRNGNDFLDAVTLPTTGTYQLWVNPADSRIGSITLAAWIAPADANLGTLPLDGTTKTVTISNPGQNGYLTFAGTAGQRVTVQTSAASATLLCCFVTWTLNNPDGSQLGSARNGNDFLDTVTLPTTGTYQLLINPADSRIGSITAAAWLAPADANLGTLPLDGTTKTATISSPGQNGYLTFTGTPGQSVTVTSLNPSATLLCCYFTFSVKRPDGSTLGARTGTASMTVVLDATGTYQLYVDPLETRVGSVTFTATVA